MTVNLALLPNTVAHLGLLILLVAGHVIGDFALQTRRIAMAKARPGVLAIHIALVAAAHATALIPYLSWPIVVLILAVSLLHGLIDAVKSRWTSSWPGRLALFFADQFAHSIVLVVAWIVFMRLVGVPPVHFPEEVLAFFVVATVLAAAFPLAWTGGSVIVRETLAGLDLNPADEAAGIGRAGHLIGALERTLVLILILFGEWAAIALLLTAKSIARFEELKDRRFSEYYLVGTLTSILVAVVIGLAVRAVIL